MPCKAQCQVLALKERTTQLLKPQPTSAVDHSHSGERKKILIRENLVCAFSNNFFPNLNFREVDEMMNVIWAFPPLENSKWAFFNSSPETEAWLKKGVPLLFSCLLFNSNKSPQIYELKEATDFFFLAQSLRFWVQILKPSLKRHLCSHTSVFPGETSSSGLLSTDPEKMEGKYRT